VERLIDKKDVSSPEEARLVEMVAAHQRTTLSDTTKTDVLGKVLARREHHRARALPMLRPALAFGILLLAGVTTAATVGHRWIAQKLQLAAPTAPAPLPQQPVARPRQNLVASPPPAVPVVVDEQTLPEPAPARRSRPHPGKSEDPSRIVAAIQALRNDHDPDRAAKLLAEYLKVYPHGALAEEGLALSIEAAAARHNSTTAAAFAEQYLKEYPNGRFRRSAEQARQSATP
jgi:hypothetical protein